MLCVIIGFKLYTEILWYRELNYLSVFWKLILGKVIIFLCSSILSFTILHFVIMQPEKIAIPLPPNYKPPTLEETCHVSRFRFGEPKINWLGRTNKVELGRLIYALVVSALMGWISASKWREIFLAIKGNPGIGEIFLGWHLGFYFFRLPAFGLLVVYSIRIAFFSALGFGLLHWFYYTRSRGLADEKALSQYRERMWKNISLNTTSFFAVFLQVPLYLLLNLPFSRHRVIFGANYTDVRVLKYIYYLFMVTIPIAALGLYWARSKSWKALKWVIAGFTFWAVILAIFPSIFQIIAVNPTELEKERPFIERHIQATRQAYGIDHVEEKEFTVRNDLTFEQLGQYKATLDNIRVADWRVLAATLSQTQTMRPYYLFGDLDIDRYVLEGRLQEVIVALREMDLSKLPADAQTWVNQRLKFTHGYGAAIAKVNQFEANGFPKLIAQDFPYKACPELQLARTEIYYGENTDGYAIVGAKIPEFDYPQGDKNVECFYSGTGGIVLDSWLKKLAFSIKFGDLEILLSNYVIPESKVLMRRQLQERIKAIAPFLVCDQDPYPVIVEGKIFWIQDAYTVSNKFPYSEPLFGDREINYLRNSVKVIMDAYDGRVSFYLWDDTDPIINTWKTIFPIFKAKGEIPEELKKHFRYPEDLFQIQSRIYAIFHMTPEVFYNKEDEWEPGQEKYGDELRQVDPYFVISQLPGEDREEFIEIFPFTPKGKHNLVGWFASRSDAPGLLVYKMPKGQFINGPAPIEAQIDQDTDMSRDLTLWTQGGSSVIRGNLLVIPLGQSLLYVEPIYLAASKAAIPQLKRVVVAYKDKVVWADTFDEALKKVFGIDSGPEFGIKGGSPLEDDIASAKAQLDRYLFYTGQQKFDEAAHAMKMLVQILSSLSSKK